MFTTVTRKRYAGSSYSSGRWTPGNETQSSMLASIQPHTPGSTELMRLPEGVRTKGLVKVYTDTELRSADETNGIQADRVVWDGHDWEVQFVDYHALGIFHYKAVCARAN